MDHPQKMFLGMEGPHGIGNLSLISIFLPYSPIRSAGGAGQEAYTGGKAESGPRT